MKTFICTHIESPEINHYGLKQVGKSIVLLATDRRAAGKLALSLPLPEGADTLMVHVGSADFNENADYELFDKGELK